MYDFHRLRFVTERYHHLQGLRLVPLGFPFLIAAAWRDRQLSWLPVTGDRAPEYWFLGLVAIAVAISIALGHYYYTRRFGAVHQQESLRGQILLVLLYALFIASLFVQNAFPLPISLPIITVAIAVGFLGVTGGHVRTHYIAVAAVALLFGSLGSLLPEHARVVLLDDLIGISLIVIGLGDHFLLRRTLEPVAHVETV
jgi:hypothetical protein